MSLAKLYAKKDAKATQRRCLHASERLKVSLLPFWPCLLSLAHVTRHSKQMSISQIHCQFLWPRVILAKAGIQEMSAMGTGCPPTQA
jgi:hypothetical protein